MATAAVEAPLTYFVDTGEKPVTYVYKPGTDPMRTNAKYAEHAMAIRDGRAAGERFTLDGAGFALVRHETGVRDFYDEAQIRAVYDDEVKALVSEVTGATRVIVFDHTLRAADETTRSTKLAREPVMRVHNDYTEKSAPQRVRDLLPTAEAESLLAHRFAIINVWRSIRGAVRTAPLAVCDARSIAPGDLISADLDYGDRVGETQRVVFNPEHLWYYFPAMAVDEALLIKCYDSATDGTARFAAHTAFDDPESPPGAPPRESIETRTFAFF